MVDQALCCEAAEQALCHAMLEMELHCILAKLTPKVSPCCLRLRKVSSAAVQPESRAREALAAGNSYVRGVS